MIDRLLPAGVASSELFSDPPELRAHPLEEELIAKAVDKRRREFIGARHCARRAMGEIGVAPEPILRGERGAPIWPRGVVGSMTHCDGYRAAVVAPALRLRSVGIDAEPHEPLPTGVLEAVSLESERSWLADPAGADAWDGVHRDKVLFCAKETTYKAWFPLTNRWLGFEDAHITFTISERNGADARGEFHSKLLVPGETIDGGPALTAFDGQWMVADGLVVAAIVNE